MSPLLLACGHEQIGYVHLRMNRGADFRQEYSYYYLSLLIFIQVREAMMTL